MMIFSTLFNLAYKRRYRRWKQFIQQLKDNTVTYETLKKTNDWWNKIDYKADDNDEWKTPEQSLKDNNIDCEDYCIGKMVTLWNSGLEKDRTELCHIQLPDGQAHMILLVWLQSNIPFVLDNRSKQVESLLAKRVAEDFNIIYRVGKKGVWVNGEYAHSNHTKWNNLMKSLDTVSYTNS